jgi:hypothetical protein
VVLYREANGKWSAKPAGKDGIGLSTVLERGAHFSLGRFSLAVETHVGSPKSFVQSRAPRQIDGLVGTSLPIQLLKQDIVSMGALKAPVLIAGETGTGKEIVARGLHRQSEHAGGPFLPVNCGGLSESMLEDTLLVTNGEPLQEPKLREEVFSNRPMEGLSSSMKSASCPSPNKPRYSGCSTTSRCDA